VFYNVLSTYDRTSLCNEISDDAAVDRLNVAVTQTIDLAVPSGYIKKHKYPAWFSGKLKVYIKRKPSVALVRKRTIPTEPPPLVVEVSTNFLRIEGDAWSAQWIPTVVNLGFLDRSRYLFFSCPYEAE
jgi:hypothetical protein